MRILIASPRFAGSGGGATVYYPLLASALLDRGHEVHVVSDASEGNTRQTRLHRVIPAKDRPRSRWRDPLVYLIQNLSMLIALPWIARKTRPDVVLVHTSLFRHPGLMPLTMRLLKLAAGGSVLVADVRDPNLPARRVGVFRQFDAVLTCGRRIKERLISLGVSETMLHDVRVIQRPLDKAQIAKQPVSVQEPYIFYAGLLSERKSVDILLEAFVDYVRPVRPEMSLVLAGQNKFAGEAFSALLAAEGVFYLGPKTHQEVLALILRSSLCVNLSPIEGLPRFCLESMMLDRPCLLPPNIPEFEELPGSLVARPPLEPSAVATQMLALVDSADTHAYPIDEHLPEAVVLSYETIFQTILSARKPGNRGG